MGSQIVHMSLSVRGALRYPDRMLRGLRRLDGLRGDGRRALRIWAALWAEWMRAQTTETTDAH